MREERETFLTSEITIALKDYLKNILNEENNENIHLKNKNIFSKTSIEKYIRKKNVDEQRT